MKSPLRSAFFLVALAVLAGPTLGADDRPAALDAMTQDYVAAHLFSGSVLVAHRGEVLLDRGYGFADAAGRVPNSPATRYRIASLTKQFSAAAILLLEERGQLKLSDPLSRFLPDSPSAWRKIQLVHLLAHTSGLHNYTDLPDFGAFESTAVTPAALVAHFRDLPLDFAPGSKFAYSNSGYAVLGLVIEKVSGRSYAEFLDENFFRPLGLTDTGYAPGQAIVTGGATGLRVVADAITAAAPIDLSTAYAAGGLHASTGDLRRWLEALLGGRVLKPAALKKMTTATKDGAGLGLGVSPTPKRLLLITEGAMGGFTSAQVYSPDDQLTVILLGNLDGPGTAQLARKLYALVDGQHPALPSTRHGVALAPEILARYPGTYTIAPGFNLVISLAHGHLVAEPTGQGRFVLIATSPTRFEGQAIDGTIEFTVDADGRATALDLARMGTKLHGVRQ